MFSKADKDIVYNAYALYKELRPLNDSSEEFKINVWEKVHRLTFLQYSSLVQAVIQSPTLDTFVEASNGDFDNLAPALQSLINTKILHVTSSGSLSSTLAPNTFVSAEDDTFKWHQPTETLNQFPCDSRSSFRRYLFLQERYAFYEKVKIALLGDDDLLSLYLDRDPLFEATVFEADPDLCAFIQKQTQNVNIQNVDLCSAGLEGDFDTFFTDPPYTVHGLNIFLKRGLELISCGHKAELKECYFIANKMMLGSCIRHVQMSLCKEGAWIEEIRNNFSHYPLPHHYNERNRADTFLQSNHITPAGLKQSSSSALYIVHYDTSSVPEEITANHSLTYNHYQW